MTKNRTIGVLILRLILGFIFLMQGYGKVFTMGVDNLYAMDFFSGAFKDILPEFIAYSTAYYTSYVELLAGIMLILGFKRNIALYLLGSVLIIVSIGHGMLEPIWDLSHVMYRAILLVALLLLPEDWDNWTIDAMIKKRKGLKGSL